MSKDDEYWHKIMHALADEFYENASVAHALGNDKAREAWASAAKEVKATADQALETAGTAARLVSTKPN